MLLIADSGSTQTDWRVIDLENQISQALSGGINPYYHDYSTILKEIQSVLPQIAHKISKVHFYGAGCSTDENVKVVRKALSSTFPEATIRISHDLLAAARALCGKEEGIACILGTGVNSCLYSGSNIVDSVSALGYILADEGSGAYLGKQLMADYLRRNVPNNVCEKIKMRFGLSKEEVLKKVYIEQSGSKYLATFSKFIFQNIKEPYFYKLVYAAFTEFFEKNIKKYENYQQYKVHFTGSVAFYYSNILRQVANDQGVIVGNIIQSPIAGLALYHQKQ